MVDREAVTLVERTARLCRHSVLVAPAVLYEAAQTSAGPLRSALLEVMCRPTWKRLMPDAYSQAEELKSEVQRLRPEWLRRPPERVQYKRLRHDWRRVRGGAWDRARNSPEQVRLLQLGTLQMARKQAYELRSDALAWTPKWRTAPLTKVLAALPSPRPGWNGEFVEAWRAAALHVWENDLRTPEHPCHDWLEGEIRLDLMLRDETSAVRFWLHDVDLLHMPRHWLVWAFEFLQRQHKVSDGTPGDAQLANYLIEADVVVSADRLFVTIADRCRTDAPIPVADAVLVPGGAGAVEKVLELLRNPPPARHNAP